MATCVQQDYETSDGLYSGEMREHPMQKYKGQWLKHGRGKLTTPGGDVYEGQFDFDAMHGDGTMTYANGDVYDGEFRGSMKDGCGVMDYADGGCYEGHWKEDRKEGDGTERYANGDRYHGLFKAGKCSGYGQLTYANGTRYEGIFGDGLPDGEGVFYYTNGDTWEGHWRAGRKHQRGIHFKPDGARYVEEYEEGACVRGVFTGFGTILYPNGDVYTGHWQKDPSGKTLGWREGDGTLEFRTGEKYEGAFHEDRMQGKGVYTFAAPPPAGEGRAGEGRREVRYEGDFYADKINGYGTMFFDNGDRHEGFWTDNRSHGLGFDVRCTDAYAGAWQADLYENGKVAVQGKYNGAFAGNRPSSAADLD